MVPVLFAAWLGTFVPAEPAAPCGDCKAPTVVARAGFVRVLPPGAGDAPPDGEVTIASPLLGLVIPGKLDHGKIDVPFFTFDQRGSDAGVIVLPAGTVARFVVATPGDVLAIKDTLIRDDVLSSGARGIAMRAFKDLEVGALDIDGDGKADVVATYGCNSWGDGACQSRGQFFLVRRGAKWVEIE